MSRHKQLLCAYYQSTWGSGKPLLSHDRTGKKRKRELSLTVGPISKGWQLGLGSEVSKGSVRVILEVVLFKCIQLSLLPALPCGCIQDPALGIRGPCAASQGRDRIKDDLRMAQEESYFSVPTTWFEVEWKKSHHLSSRS